MKAKPELFLGLLLVFCWVATTASIADSWPPPKNSTTYSPTQEYRFQVQIPQLASPVSFESLSAEDFSSRHRTEAALGNVSPRLTCEGVLERRSDGGDYEIIWRRPLLNKVAPARVKIFEPVTSFSNAKVMVVTLDDHGSVGTSTNTVVIYSHSGQTVRRLSLPELVKRNELQRMPRSVSSIHWLRSVDFSTNAAQMHLALSTGTQIKIDLNSGAVIP